MSRSKVIVLVVVLMVFLFPSSLFAKNIFLGLSLGGGYTYNPQLDDVVEGAGDEAADLLNTEHGVTTFRGEDEKSGVAVGIDLEGRVYLDNLGIGLSIGFHQAGRAESTAKSDSHTAEYSFKAMIVGLPILLTGYYKIGFENLYIVLGAGVGWYNSWAIADLEIKDSPNTSLVHWLVLGGTRSSDGNEYERTWGAWGSTVGVHAKGEIHLALGFIDIFGGVMGRYAEVTEFKDDDGEIVKLKSQSSGEYENLVGSFTGVFFYIGAGLAF